MTGGFEITPVEGGSQLRDEFGGLGQPTVPGGWRTVSRRLFRNRMSVLGVGIVGLLLVAVVIGPLIWSVDPLEQDRLHRVAAPSWAHPLGTDLQGRDVLARVLHGGRVSLLIALAAVAIAFVVGGGLGLVAGYVRGFLDNVAMRIMDVILSFPSLLLALIIATARGPGIGNTMFAVAVAGIPRFARLMRAMVLSVREQEYVFAARVAGIGPGRVMVRHVLPNSIAPSIVQASVGVGIALFEVASLGYLGVGVQQPTPEWGAILSSAQAYLVQEPVLLLAPGLVVSLAILGFNLLGDALRDVVDPQR